MLVLQKDRMEVVSMHILKEMDTVKLPFRMSILTCTASTFAYIDIFNF